jgi:hypothetical protein
VRPVVAAGESPTPFLLDLPTQRAVYRELACARSIRGADSRVEWGSSRLRAAQEVASGPKDSGDAEQLSV